MNFDEKAVKRLLSLSDAQLENLIRTIGVENGIDLSSFHITSTDAASIRTALSGLTESDIQRESAELSAYKTGKHGSGRNAGRSKKT